MFFCFFFLLSNGGRIVSAISVCPVHVYVRHFCGGGKGEGGGQVEHVLKTACQINGINQPIKSSNQSINLVS